MYLNKVMQQTYEINIGEKTCCQRFDAVGWAAGRAFGL